MKLIIENADKKSNLDKIAADKFVVGYIDNFWVDTPTIGIIIPDHLTISLINFLISPIFGFSILGCAILGFSIFDCFFPSFFILSFVRSSVFFCFGFSIFFLADLDVFFHNFSIASYVKNSIIKFLAKFLINIFSSNLFDIAHYFDNGCMCFQIFNISIKVGITNLFLDVNVIFNACS